VSDPIAALREELAQVIRSAYLHDINDDNAIEMAMAIVTDVQLKTIDAARQDVDRALVLSSNGVVTPEWLRRRLSAQRQGKGSGE
jgi:hypothetical protein